MRLPIEQRQLSKKGGIFMKMLSYAIVGLLLTTMTTTAHADDGDDARLKAGITAGTLGIGPEVSYRLSERLGVRGNVTFLSISRDIESDDITYDGKLKLQSGGVMLDVYPFGGGFR